MSLKTELKTYSKKKKKIISANLYAEKCRLCLNSSEYAMVDLRYESRIVQILRDMGNLELKMDNNNFPKKVCVSCLHCMKRVDEVHTFLNKCRTSETTLNNWLQTSSCGIEMPKANAILLRSNLIPIQSNGNSNNKSVKSHAALELETSNHLIDIKGKQDFIVLNEFSQQTPSVKEEIIVISTIDDLKTDWINDEMDIKSDEDVNLPESQCDNDGTHFDNDETQFENENLTNLTLNEDTCETNLCIASSSINEKTNPQRKYVHKREMCEKCGKLTSNLSRHKLNNNQCSHDCDQCDFTTIDKKLLRAHLIRHKKENKIPQYKKCDVCGAEVESLLRHRKENKSCWFKCDQCDTSLSKLESMKRHKESVHGQPKYICEICSAVYKFQTSLKRHLRLHKYGLEFTCEVCGKQFSTKIGLEEHQNVHQKMTRYKCPHCKVKFPTHSAKSGHIKNFHPEHKTRKVRRIKPTLTGNSKPKQYVCKVCDKVFRSYGGFWIHSKLHRGPNNLKKYKCDECAREFLQQMQLITHQRVHTGEKPFKCQICGTYFRQQAHLASHMRVHKNIKNHACGICGKAFVFKNNMLEHELRHKKLRPFPCHVCSKGFYTSSSRKKHVLTTHGQEEVENIRKHTWKIDIDNSTS